MATTPTEFYTLSLHDALPICIGPAGHGRARPPCAANPSPVRPPRRGCSGPFPVCAPALRSRPDRKSTRLNSSHGSISYAVFCLKKKKREQTRVYILTSDEQKG